MNTVRRVTLQHIASEAGVSRATASRALRSHPAIPAETRERVQEVARRLGHTLNPVLSTLMTHVRAAGSGKQLGTLAYLTAWPTRDRWKHIATDAACFRGASERAVYSGYGLEEFWLKEPGMTSRRMSQILDARGIRGLIAAPLPFPPARGHLSLDWPRFAAVTLGYSVWRPNLDRVASHHGNNIVRAVHELRRLGYRRIGLAVEDGMDERLDRNLVASFQFVQQGMRPADRVPVWIVENDNRESFRKWIRSQRPDVVVSYGGPALRWLRELELHIPREIGLVELELSEASGACTGINQHSEALAATAVDLLVAQLHRHEYGLPKLPKLILVEGTWVAGATVRRGKP